jgi:hypothetical protein
MRDLTDDIRDLLSGKKRVKSIIDDLDTFPERIWVLQSMNNEHLTMTIPENRDFFGMPCFSTSQIAELFSLAVLAEKDLTCSPVEISFDDAREVAKDMPNCRALLFYDDPENFVLHWVT